MCTKNNVKKTDFFIQNTVKTRKYGHWRGRRKFPFYQGVRIKRIELTEEKM